jgi:riboflavin synthase
LFSGIVEEIAAITELTEGADGRKFRLSASIVTQDIALGHSISVSGCCLTVVNFGPDWFEVELVQETLRKTTMGHLGVGGRVNLERSLKMSDRLGGHMVSGHIETVATVIDIEQEGFSKVMTFALGRRFAPYFVEKGSVAIEGVSLTVWGLAEKAGIDSLESGLHFKVALIPHTLSVTTLGDLSIGSKVNIETDIVARYVARWLEPSLVSHNLIKS